MENTSISAFLTHDEGDDMKTDAEIRRLAVLVIQAHDDNEWDERTYDTDFGDALENLRKSLGIDPPYDREEEVLQ